jgi:proteasome-associated ATPase
MAKRAAVRAAVKEKASVAFDTLFFRKELKAEIASLKKSITKLLEDIAKQKGEASAQAKIAGEMEARLTESNRALEAQIAKNQTDAQESIAGLKRSLEEKQEHLERLEGLLEGKREEIQKLEDRLVTEAANLQRALDEHRVTLSNQRKDLTAQAKKEADTRETGMREHIKRLERERTGILADNEKHVATINQMKDLLAKQKDAIKKLKEDLDKLMAPALLFAVFDRMIDADSAEVYFRGEKRIVGIHSDCSTITQAKFGHTVILDGGANVILEFRDEPAATFGEECTFVQIYEEFKGHIMVATRMDANRVMRAAYTLDINSLKAGDHLLYEPKQGIAYYKLPKLESDKLLEEEIPDVSFSDIGGHDDLIKKIIEEFEYPYLYPEMYALLKTKAPKGLLLSGPPGCGKSMIAKAIACEMIKRGFKNQTGEKQKAKFFLVNGPDLINKYVGESERNLRELFAKAHEATRQGFLAIIFFDEIDSLLPMRGSGISSDIEKTIVAQMTTLLDGMKEIQNIIVVGATNRPELLDPAIQRPGRLDLHFHVPRPNEENARKIFELYLTPDLPFHPQYFVDTFVWHDCFAPREEWEEGKEGKRCERELSKDPKKITKYFIDRILARIYWDGRVIQFKSTSGKSITIDNRFVRLTFVENDTKTFYFKDFTSGAMFKNITDRAKKKAIVEFVDAKKAAEEKGLPFTEKNPVIRTKHFLDAAEDEFRERGSLPNTVNPSEWSKLVGDGRRLVVNVEILQQHKTGNGDDEPSKENVLPGGDKKKGGGGSRVI